jgi:hypothetical protein
MKRVFFLLALAAASYGQTLGTASTSLTTADLTYFGGSTRTVVRTAELGGHFFVVEYLVQFGGLTFVPSTYPAGKPHYSAAITVFEVVGGSKVQIGKTFDGQYTDDEGCFEDDPLSLIELAYAKKPPATVIWAIAEKRDRAAFEAMPLYRESDGVLEVTAKGKRDLYQVKIGNRVLWTNPNPSKKPQESVSLTIPFASGTASGSITFGK